MVRTVIQRNLAIDDGITGDDAILHLLSHTLVDRSDVLARHDAASDRIFENVTFARLERLDTKKNMAVLAAPAGLTNEFAFLLNRLANRLPIGYLRLTDICLNTEFSFHAIDNDVEM